MSVWSRIANIFRGDRLSREIDEELESHIAEAVEQGRELAEARKAFGSVLLWRDQSRDVRVWAWLDSLRADAIFGWRQLRKKKVTSAAAILSLALAIGACTSAFRLIDALLLRPLPVADPERLYTAVRRGIDFDGKLRTGDSWAYPSFHLMRTAVKDKAELIAVSYAQRMDLTFKSDQEMEKAYLQYVSGWMFGSFGLRPAVGRILTENDDLKPGAHPVAVISYDYWTRHFARDPRVIGRTFRMSNKLYEIVGVVDSPFTGTETGTATDVFVPTMMHPGVTADDWTWHRTLVRIKPDIAIEPVRAKLHATSRAFEEERAKGFTDMTRESINKILDQTVLLVPAAAGASELQQEYQGALAALSALVALVLLIACANVANLLSAQAATRSREMALRVSIGAGRFRLVQLVLVECAMIAFFALAMGGLFAWWSAPFVISRINPPDNPARLSLPADWRVLGFGLLLAVGVTVLFGLAPALRASAVTPSSALKGGDNPHSRRRSMRTLIGVQAAFCFIVLFLAGLFVATFERLSHRPIGFSAQRLLTLNTVAEPEQPPILWDQVAEHLRSVPGIEMVALAGWPLLDGNAWNGFVSVNGAPPGPVLAYFLRVSPGWLDTMKIHLLEGRDFRPSDTTPGAAIVNEAFVKQYLDGKRPIGAWFKKGDLRFNVVGVVGNAPYGNLREPTLPSAYVPFHSLDANNAPVPIGMATFIVRTVSANPLAMASILRHQVPQARPGFRVSNIRSQEEINAAQTVRERLLAILASFFAVVALTLASIGLYGVMDYSVLQRRHEIGIRMAIGASPADIAQRVTLDVFSVVFAGAVGGLALSLTSARYIETLLYDVNATEPGILALPWLIMVTVACLAAVPAVIRAVSIDPAATLRSE